MELHWVASVPLVALSAWVGSSLYDCVLNLFGCCIYLFVVFLMRCVNKAASCSGGWLWKDTIAEKAPVGVLGKLVPGSHCCIVAKLKLKYFWLISKMLQNIAKLKRWIRKIWVDFKVRSIHVCPTHPASKKQPTPTNHDIVSCHFHIFFWSFPPGCGSVRYCKIIKTACFQMAFQSLSRYFKGFIAW